jgi:hypothetical protein
MRESSRFSDFRIVIASALVLQLAALESAAQRPGSLLIVDEPTCPQCAIRLTPRAEIGGPSGSKKIRELPAAIVVDNANRYWVLGPGTPLVFDSTGQELGQIASGRERNRPLVRPYDALPIADSVVVFDPISGVAAVIGPDLRWVRDIGFNIPVTRIGALRWPDLLIGSGIASTPSAAGWPLHRISAASGEATLISSFGSGDGELRVGGAEQIYERVALIGKGNSFWSFRRASYELSQWDSTDAPKKRLVRRPSWFPESVQSSIGGPRQAPSPVISAVQVDSSGLLWVFASVPSDTWPSAWPAALPGLVELSTSSIAFEKLYHTAIEVIDPSINRVIARSFLDSWIVEALPNRRAVTYSVDVAGGRHFSVVSLSLDRGEARPRRQ